MTIASILAPYVFSGGGTSRDGFYARASTEVPDNFDDHSGNSAPHPGDVALLHRIQASDEDAMRTLVLEYADRLTRFAFTIVRSADEAEEIAFDVLANVWKRRDRLRSDRSLRAYLFASVRHRAIDLLAHERVRARKAVVLEEDIRFHLSASTPESAYLAGADSDIRTAQVVALREAITTLSDRHRLGLHLRFEQGMSYPEIGKVLNISDKAAQQIVLRAIGTLRRVLGV